MAKKTAGKKKTAKGRRAGGPRRRGRVAAAATLRVKRVKLPPSVPAGRIECGRDLKWAGVTVGPEGSLPVAPVLLQVCTGDVVTWLVSNQSGRPLRVRLKEFQRKSTGKAIAPIRWFQENMSITHGSVGTITGEVVLLPEKGTEVEYVKYTIEVRGPAAIDYDPDLEIRPPAI